jgi:hypothetical protein
MVAAIVILCSASFAAGGDPLGIAVITAACAMVLLVTSRPALVRVQGAGGPSLSSLVWARLGRPPEGGGGSDCPVILTVIRR